ncbi:MAG: hypothetical protein DYG89_37450 [Caldilinea sp. CFX5]|nr:hypothetical protein [Caldilinea sp. CFX5]
MVNKPIHTVSWQRRAGVWLGISINPAAISVGGGLAIHLPLRDLFWLIPLGAALLTLLCTMQGLAGRRRGQRLNQIAGATFGTPWGAGLLNLLMGIGMMGWGGFHGGVSGASVAQLFHLPGWVGALLVATTIFTLAELGVNRWSAVSWLTTSAALGLTIFALSAVDLTLPTEPTATAPLADWFWAIGTVIAYATLFALRNPDFTWDMASDGDVWKISSYLFFPLIFSMSVGALLYYATGHWNIADILTMTRSATLGHLFLLLAVTAPLLSGLYSGALALSSVTRLHLRYTTALICSMTFVLASLRFDQRLLPFLGLNGAALGPALGVMLLSRWLSRKPSTKVAFLAWLIGAATAIVGQIQGQSVAIVLGAAVSLLVIAGNAVVQGVRRDKP